ncbi:MAG: copper amine oxidase N-terminal domain-containing protein [Bacillota bacterium]|nr:copper amine oxidase N-terminal domain-containing protein [Bacillota bacterium]
MRKTLTAILTLTFILALALPAFAETQKATFVLGQQSYTVDGVTKQMDAKAFAENGRTYVPVRYLGYALGMSDKDITWNQQTQTATLNWPHYTKFVELTLGNKRMYVCDGPKDWHTTMDVAPLARDGRIYLPARFVAEAFDYYVGWDPTTRTVTVSKEPLSEPVGGGMIPGSITPVPDGGGWTNTTQPWNDLDDIPWVN